jgi:uncharacterized protein YggE
VPAAYLLHHHEEETMKPIRIAAVAALVLVAAAIAGVGRPEEARSEQGTTTRGITVNASGKVETAPDRAALELGVETQASNAKDALRQNAERLSRVIDALRKAGVAKDDLRTSNVSLWPQRESDSMSVTGYQAQNTVSAELDIAKAGDAIDAAVAAGANVVSGPSMSVSERDELYRKALKNAVEAASRRSSSRRNTRRPARCLTRWSPPPAPPMSRLRSSLASRRSRPPSPSRSRSRSPDHVPGWPCGRPGTPLPWMAHDARDDRSLVFQLRRRHARPYALAGVPLPASAG